MALTRGHVALTRCIRPGSRLCPLPRIIALVWRGARTVSSGPHMQVLARAEARERKLGALEAAQAARQQALEAAHATHLADAQAVVRRLQVQPYP